MLLRMLLLMVVNVINTLRLFNRFIRKMVCWFVGWWFEFWLLCRFLVLRDVWQKCWNLNARIHSKIVLKNCEISLTISPKLVQNPSKIDQKRSQTDEDASLERLRDQIGPRSAPGRSWPYGVIDIWSPFWLKMVLQGVILEPSGGPKSVKNHTFGPRSAQGPSKNDFQKGVWKNIKI